MNGEHFHTIGEYVNLHWWECKMYNVIVRKTSHECFSRTYWLRYDDTAVSLLCMHPKQAHVRRYLKLQVISAVFIISKKQEQFKYTSVYEGIKKSGPYQPWNSILPWNPCNSLIFRNVEGAAWHSVKWDKSSTEKQAHMISLIWRI